VQDVLQFKPIAPVQQQQMNQNEAIEFENFNWPDNPQLQQKQQGCLPQNMPVQPPMKKINDYFSNKRSRQEETKYASL
jgi:hypothetical protein